MKSLHFSPLARQDLRDIFSYIETDNPSAAARVIRNIVETCKLLEDFPELGRLRDELQTTRQVRSLGCMSYSVFYEVEGSIQVLRILHKARDVGGEFD